MSALVNLTASPIIIASSTTILPIIPLHRDFLGMEEPLLGGFRPPLAGQPPHRIRLERERLIHQKFLEEEREKQRRSVNIPAYHKPKDARLISTSRNRCLEIREDGGVQTTGILNSLHAVFEVVFWCHVLPFFASCSKSLESTPFSDTAFSTVLLRYKAANRYMCIDKHGKVYSLPPPVNASNYTRLEECVFQSAYLSNQYDVYYSRQYPAHSKRCRGADLTGDSKAEKRERTCNNRWYLGVDKRGNVRTVKTPESKMKQNTFFITRWVHEQRGQSLPDYHHPLSPTSPLSSPVPQVAHEASTERPRGGLFEVKPPRTSKSVFSILFGHKRNFYRHRTFLGGADERENSRAPCTNLLRNCDTEADAKRSNHAIRRIPPTKHVTREQSEAYDSSSSNVN